MADAEPRGEVQSVPEVAGYIGTPLAPVKVPVVPPAPGEVLAAVSPTELAYVPIPAPAVPGDPNALLYENPAGTAAITDPALTAAPLDPFGRPQILDRRQAPGPTGPVYRQGAWTADGDPVDLTGEGIVIYGPAPNGMHDGANGMIGRVKYNRFQLRLIIAGFDVGSAWRVDDVHEFFTNDLGVQTAEIVRDNGAAYFGSVRTPSAVPAEAPPGVFDFDPHRSNVQSFVTTQPVNVILPINPLDGAQGVLIIEQGVVGGALAFGGGATLVGPIILAAPIGSRVVVGWAYVGGVVYFWQASV